MLSVNSLTTLVELDMTINRSARTMSPARTSPEGWSP